MAIVNIVDDIHDAEGRITHLEEALGKGLQQPFNNTNSGSRKILSGTHIEHTLPLLHPEPPLVSTGYENRFGEHSSSFVLADSDYTVLARVAKFSMCPDHCYYLIIMDNISRKLGVIERISYHHITETYGYLYNNKYIDRLKPDDIIPKGEVIRKSLAFDDYNNRQDGVNLITGYLSCDDTMEDSILLSSAAVPKLASPLIKKVQIIVNDNDIMLNLYGDDENYKSFPDINEKVLRGFLCGIRREKKEECLFTQSTKRLKDIMMSDEKYTVEGRVVDINVYCNSPENITNSFYNKQLKKYYDDGMLFAKNIVEAVNTYLAMGLEMSYDLQKLYYVNKRKLSGDQYIKDRPFSNIIMEIVLLEENIIDIGDKLSDRYGGKGVVAKIIPEDLMPMLDNGEHIEIIFNSSTCVNRLNAGQLFEVSLNHIAQRLLDCINTKVFHVDEILDLYIKLLSLVAPEQGNYIKNMIDSYHDEDELTFLIDSISEFGIMMSIKPISESMDIDRLNTIYQEFEGMVGQYTITVPQKDSNGNIRYIEARRTIPCGKKYIYRLKQYAEEKFSVTSLSATNIRNENSRSKTNKSYKSLYTKTPIKFGEMETGDMGHLGMEAVIVNLMLHSASPHARRLTEELLTGDPFNIDIKLDNESKNRNVEILNAYLKTMGLRLVFKKRLKQLDNAILFDLIKECPNGRGPLIWPIHPDEHFDPDYISKAIEQKKKLRDIIRFYGIEFV